MKKIIISTLVILFVIPTISIKTAHAADTVRPSRPSGLAGLAISATQIDLSWKPSSDNVEVTGYKIYRDGVFLTTVQTIKFSDMNLVSNVQYTYQVSAIDAASNESAKSIAMSAIVLNPDLAKPIDYGETKSASLTTPGTIDMYRFAGQAGDKVIVSFGETPSNGNFETRIRAYDSQGKEVSNIFSTTSGELIVTLQRTDSYTLWVSDSDYKFSSVASYAFTLQRLNNPIAGVISFGDIKTGTLSSVCALNVYKLNAQSGDKLIVNFGETLSNGNFETRVRVYSNSGTEIANKFSTTTGQITAVLPIDGEYSIFVSDSNYYFTGNAKYSVSIVENFIENLVTTPKFFNPSSNEHITFQWDQAQAATVRLDLYSADLDIANVLQKKFLQTIHTKVYPKGHNSFTWNGMDASNKVFSPGSYSVALDATATQTARHLLYDPQYVPGTVTFKNSKLILPNANPYKGKSVVAQYDLVAPSWVTLKIGIKGALSANRTLILNAPRDVTGNSDTWDGRDDAGKIVPAGTYIMSGWANILPDNSLVIRKITPLLISSFTADPYAFFPIYSEQINIEYKTSVKATVSLEVRNNAGVVIRTLLNGIAQNAGTYTLAWNGKDSLGRAVNIKDDYKLRLTTVDEKSNVVIKEINVRIFN